MRNIEEISPLIPLSLVKSYEEALGIILGAGKHVRAVTHYDADGLCAGALLSVCLHRAGIPVHLSVARALGEDTLASLKKESPDIVVFCDMGSGQVDLIEKTFEGVTVVVFDHHIPLRESTIVHQVNPHFTDIDGTHEACAATVLFLFTIAASSKNWDLYDICLAGVIGDKQHLGGLKGLNQRLLDEAKEKGLVKSSKGLLLDPGPLSEVLQDTLEPYFTDLSGRPEKVEKFLRKAKIDGNMTADSLSAEKLAELTSLLSLKVLSQGAQRDIVEGLVSTRYHSTKRNLDIRDLSNLVNSCGRMGREETGIAVCAGDSESAAEASEIRRAYRAKVREGLLKLEKDGPKRMKNIQWFYSDDPSIAGSHAGVGMMYFFNQDRPVVALSRVSGEIRVSSRGTPHLISIGVDLASACRSASSAVGGHGGGHNIAAGATIPAKAEKEFLEKMDEIVGQQLAASSSGRA